MNRLVEWSDGKSALDGVSIEQIAAGCGTPLYVYSEPALRRQFAALRKALPPQIDIFYSIKSNPHPKVVGVFVQQGAGCEIASGGEYALAMHAGAIPERIVFAGPGKGRDELEYVVARGIGEIHVESFEELEMLEQIGSALNQRITVALRVNPSAGSGGGLMMGGAPTAFGFEEESLASVVERLASCKYLRLCGVHVYTGTQILSADGLLQHWQHAVEVAKTATLTGGPIATIDLGGGLGIPYFAHETELDLEVLGAGAKRLVEKSHTDPRLAGARFVVEPGRFLSGPAGIYIARVRSVKTCRGTTFVVLDGGMNHHLAASGNLGQVIRRDFPIVNLSQPQSDAESTVVIVGPLCTPIDTLGRKVTLVTPRTGDLLGILQSGAYGLTASPARFLSHATPAEVLVNNGTLEVITPRQEFFVNAGGGGAQLHDGSYDVRRGQRVSTQAKAPARLERVSKLSVETFVSEYLQKNRPVVVSDAMRDWAPLDIWKPDALTRRFGSQRVQIYGDLFRLAGIGTLAEYLQRYFGKESAASASVPYVRWYCHLADDERVPWADDAFKKFQNDWARPYFFPDSSFVLPHRDASEKIDPTRDWFPARGLFISAKGARTRLHADPWCSDALLCQLYGRKEFVMYGPEQARFLTNAGKTVDVEAPHTQAFPDFSQAHPEVRDTLQPGEIVLVPAGWFHHFNSVTDSVSLTWNFVHACRLQEFILYLLRTPSEGEMKQLAYAYLESPAAREPRPGK